VVFQACLNKPKIVMTLSLTARWKISIDIRSFVIAHFPDCDSILSSLDENYKDPDSEYEDLDLEYSGSDLE
jgi:hypothetical protein